jgi:hypothetical protein
LSRPAGKHDVPAYKGGVRPVRAGWTWERELRSLDWNDREIELFKQIIAGTDDQVVGVGGNWVEYRITRYLQFNGQGRDGPAGRIIPFVKTRMWHR